jgi:ribosome-interacting GTPase 1
MPANLPPAYHNAEQSFRAAKTTEEKIVALEEMLRLMPKHKGTDKLQADIKARLAKLRKQPRKKGATRTFSHVIPHEGAGQVALVGPPNSGKSSLVAFLTRAKPEVAEFPFTTREPVPGMMPFEDIAFQLIDLPPLSDEYMEPWIVDLIRRADLAWLVVESSASLDGMDQVLRLLEPKRVGLFPASAEAPEEKRLGWIHKPTLLVITRSDRPGSEEDIGALRELLTAPWPIAAVSTVSGRGLEDLKRLTFDVLRIMRVYTKQPGKPADLEQPFALERGSTVGDLAGVIHKDLRKQIRYARIWGKKVFDGQTVQRDHVLEEGDVVEIHI